MAGKVKVTPKTVAYEELVHSLARCAGLRRLPHLHAGGAKVGAVLLWPCHDCEDLRPL
jgi:hypothetical protein